MRAGCGSEAGGTSLCCWALCSPVPTVLFSLLQALPGLTQVVSARGMTQATALMLCLQGGDLATYRTIRPLGMAWTPLLCRQSAEGNADSFPDEVTDLPPSSFVSQAGGDWLIRAAPRPAEQLQADYDPSHKQVP